MTTNRLRFAVSDTSENAKERKKALRAYMKERRGENENRDVKETLLLENLFKAIERVFGQTAGAGMRRTYFVYLSFSSEAPTDKLIFALTERGEKVCCPRLENGDMLAVEYGEDFTVSKYGIREPAGEAYEGNIDVVIAPLLAVDGRGNRLGYGGGYYDRFFKAYPNAKRIGYCFDFQVLKEVPTESGDEKLDIVVTDKRVFFTERNGAETKEYKKV